MSLLMTDTSLETQLRQAKAASFLMSSLATAQKNEALVTFAQLIEENHDALLIANVQDVALAEQEGLSSALYQRLKLDKSKLAQVVQGMRDMVALPDPVGTVLATTQLDEGLILTKKSVPIGVIGVIFEARPDVIPQILSLILKSGNVAVLKGGREARHTNAAFMSLVDKLNRQLSYLPSAWAQLLDSREAVQSMLTYPQYVDLIVPRGSNQLVQSIMAATRIPVLGHADGICHLYVHAAANIDAALPVIIDAKAQYPAACNALETLLVDVAIASAFLPRLAQAAQAAQISLKGDAASRAMLPDIAEATQDDWHTEYGDLTLAVKVVADIDEAIDHINHYGSHHTDGILTRDPAAQATFCARVDSANVFVNASTRFADGFRFGLGAELGISTAKTHARGPVGLEGLVIYQYQVHGTHHIVSDYVGPNAKPFQHRPL